MKKLLFVILSVLLFTSCCNQSYQQTYKLIAYTDKSSTQGNINGIFVLGIGSFNGNLNEELIYRIMAVDDNGDVYPISLNSKRVKIRFISSNETPKIAITCSESCGDNLLKFAQLSFGRAREGYLSYIIYVPNNSISYSNSFDGM